MAVKTKPKTYETSDGREFESKDEADHHEDFVQRRKAYEDAKERYEWALAERCITADGQPFSFDRWSYYSIVGLLSVPRLVRVNPSRWMNLEIESRDGKVDVIFHEQRQERQREWVSFRMSELYADPYKAQQALLAKQREWLRQQAKEIQETEKRVQERDISRISSL